MEIQNTKQSSKWRCADWRNDRLDTLGWAMFFIWAALVTLIGATQTIPGLVGKGGWAVFFTGVGVLLWLGALARRLIPRFRRPVAFELICGSFMLALGLGDSVFWIWPVVLTLIGLIILRDFFRRSSRRQS